jgi:hypothetical protein
MINLQYCRSKLELLLIVGSYIFETEKGGGLELTPASSLPTSSISSPVGHSDLPRKEQGQEQGPNKYPDLFPYGVG